MSVCQRLARKTWIAIVVGLASAATGDALAATERFQDIEVEVIGTGRPVLMIPGLNSGAETWRDTCQALQADRVQCHLVHLPGFAGVPTAKLDAFLPAMRDRLLAYIDAKQLQRPVVMGHSLGGVLGLQMAIKAPGAIERLVIVDSLPYLAAVRDPSMTVEKMRPFAAQMDAGMRASDDATFLRQAETAAAGMAQAADRIALLKQWSASSDRNTTTQAMVEMMITDLRGDVSKIKVPTLVLGAWAAFKPYGSTLESTRAIFATQFAQLPGVRIEMSQTGYHFIMWDDPTWLQSQVRAFIAPERDAT